MRALAGWILVLALAGAPALAGTGGAGEGKDAAAKSNGTSAATENSSTPTADAPKAEAQPKAATPATPSMENQVQQLRDLVEAQSRQLQAQNEQLREQQRKMYQMEDQLRAVNTTVENSGLAINPATNAGFIAYNGDEKKDDNPTAIRFKGVTIQPGGFFAAEGVYRNRALSNDVNTDFKAIPMPGSSQAKASELNFSGRQSQLTLLVTGKLDNIRLRGYEEGDFLSAGVTSNNNQTNSYTFRQRQLWAQATFDSGWQFTGGQMWSLVTETSHLLDPLTEVRPRTIDAQYSLGFSWTRQFGFRVSKNFGDKFSVGLSVENPQTTFTAHSFAINNVVAHNGVAGTNDVTIFSTVSNGNFLLGAPGDLSGLFNNQANYSFNVAPDFVFKAALEPGWGHYEVFGLVSTFRSRIFPCAVATATPVAPCPANTASTLGATNDTRAGGGFGANARAPFFNKHLDVGLHALVGSGVGRYADSNSEPDATIRGDGTLALLRSVQALGSLELHLGSKLDVYGYAGGDYVGKGSYTSATGATTGYGSSAFTNSGCGLETLPNGGQTLATSVSVPVIAGGSGTKISTGQSPTAYNGFLPGALGSCNADTRAIIEGTLGFWYRFYQGPRGRLQYGAQYSYVTRNAWGDAAGRSPHGVENMGFASFRYYLP